MGGAMTGFGDFSKPDANSSLLSSLPFLHYSSPSSQLNYVDATPPDVCRTEVSSCLGSLYDASGEGVVVDGLATTLPVLHGCRSSSEPIKRATQQIASKLLTSQFRSLSGSSV
jgi:hypothetical protein